MHDNLGKVMQVSLPVRKTALYSGHSLYYTNVFTMEWLEIDPVAFVPIGGVSLSTVLLKLQSRLTEK